MRLIYLLFVIFCSCGKTPVFQADDQNHSYVMLGQGGGFVGLESYDIIRDDGIVFTKSIKDSTAVYSHKITKANAQLSIEQSQATCLLDSNQLVLSNTYKFIAVSTPYESCRRAWSVETSTPSKNAKKIFDTITKTISNAL